MKMTESPLTKSFEIYLSLLAAVDFLPLFPLGTSVHISTTLSKTKFMCLSKALTLPSIFLLFLSATNI